MASETSRENWPSPPCNPFRATPRWWYARFSVSEFFVSQARCDAESASMALMTKSCESATWTRLYLSAMLAVNCRQTHVGIFAAQGVQVL